VSDEVKVFVDTGLVYGSFIRAHPVYRELQAKLAEVEAQCSAMRRAIAFVLMDSSNPTLPGILNKALWGQAGEALLERLDKAERFAEELREANSGLYESRKRAEADVRRETLEEAAKVAEEVGRRWLGRGSAAFEEVAAAIRALSKEPVTPGSQRTPPAR
jgi:hypothetical protein